jgi:hypothetical protein
VNPVNAMLGPARWRVTLPSGAFAMHEHSTLMGGCGLAVLRRLAAAAASLGRSLAGNGCVPARKPTIITVALPRVSRRTFPWATLPPFGPLTITLYAIAR